MSTTRIGGLLGSSCSGIYLVPELKCLHLSKVCETKFNEGKYYREQSLTLQMDVVEITSWLCGSHILNIWKSYLKFYIAQQKCLCVSVSPMQMLNPKLGVHVTTLAKNNLTYKSSSVVFNDSHDFYKQSKLVFFSEKYIV